MAKTALPASAPGARLAEPPPTGPDDRPHGPRRIAEPGQAELCVLLTPRETGGHEGALLGWLADAVRLHGLQLRIAATTPALEDACAAAGLGDAQWPGLPRADHRAAVLQVLRCWPADRPLLLAPGVLHAQAWLLAAAVALGHEVWVYVPMAYSARHMGYRHAALRDSLLAPWLRNVRLWITVDGQQCRWLHRHWGLPAPVQVLPNLPRLAPQPAPACRPATDHRLRVAWVGRFDLWQKGLDWLSGLLRADAHWHQHFRWHFQGRGPGEAALQGLASALGPQHALVHPHAPIHQALACNDVLLVPSRYEGMPLVALEATALGWPVVASRQAGLATLLPPSALFDFGDAHGLHKALTSMHTPAARAQAVAHAQDRLARQHTPQQYRPALASLVHHLRRGRHGNTPPRRQAGPC